MQLQYSRLNADLLEKVSLFETNTEAAMHIQQRISSDKPFVISFINAHAYNLTITSKDFYNALLQSDIILRDGIGMSILYKSIKKNPGANLNGTDFIPYFIEQLNNKKIALLGTVNPYLKNAETLLKQKGSNIVLTENGFLNNNEYFSLIKASQAEVIILGMGMPKQEQLSVFLKNSLYGDIIIINGGAIIDFWGGKIKRAPKLMRQLQLEWLYRLIIEPRRLFARYIIGNYIFLKKIPGIRKLLSPKKSKKNNSDRTFRI